ncbi:MAG TPA: cation transporter [Dissulfurispiraceae bacterium]|nr:cation transporter [Dissulfurispiraceae bacterium]
MTEVTLTVEGMSCQHCVMRVKKALDAVQGVVKSEVVIGRAVVSFDETKTSEKEVGAAVENAGYKIKR